jgi:RND family efflux transporter MFP subunit
MRISNLFILLLMFASSNALTADNHGHADNEAGHEEAGEHEEEAVAELTPEQIRTAGIETITVKSGQVADILIAPGEVMLNAYRTIRVTPRIEAQIVKRHARLGDHVEAGDPLVTLSSVVVAEAQGQLLVSDREWKRVQKLGRKVVSERRYIEAQVARQQAFARVLAYGMTGEQIKILLRKGNASEANGELELLSTQAGTVIEDDFIVGELAEPGRILFTITDESSLWVDARLNAEDANRVRVGTSARIRIGNQWLDGQVIQTRHALDESTRTLSVRLEVANPDDRLHPGQFVTVEIQSTDSESGIAVPVAAVMRSPDGDWQVFIEEAPGRFEPREVEVLRTVGKQLVVEGLREGEVIVSKGAFFIQSEIAKSGFEIHNH